MPPGEKGKSQRFTLHIGDAEFGEGPHHHPTATPPELLHEKGVARAASGYEEFEREGAMAQILSHGCR